jgi:hypothetical protein
MSAQLPETHPAGIVALKSEEDGRWIVFSQPFAVLFRTGVLYPITYLYKVCDIAQG